jgi:hypothetical protein
MSRIVAPFSLEGTFDVSQDADFALVARDKHNRRLPLKKKVR